MRVAVDWRSSSTECYRDFKIKNPEIKLSFIDWKNIIYTYNEMFKLHILETGERIKFPMGLGELSIIKKKRKSRKGPNNEYNNLPIDWAKTKLKGKTIYHLNHHTDGYFFGWIWFKSRAIFKFSEMWYFKPSRITSRLLAHYIKVDDKYKHLYIEWKTLK